MQEQHQDQPRQSRWFRLPRVSAADWDAVRESQIPAGTDIYGEANFVIRLSPADQFSALDWECEPWTPDAPFAMSVHQALSLNT